MVGVMSEGESPGLTPRADPPLLNLRRLGLLLLEVAVTVGAIALLLRGIGVDETIDAFADADYRWFVPAALFLFLDLQVRALRWRLLLDLQRPVSHQNLFGASNVGYLVNNILPFRAGEVARVLLIDRLERTGKIRAGASAFSERMVDVLAMIVLLVALFPMIDEPDWATGPALVFGAAAVVGFAGLLVLSHLNDAGAAFWQRPLRRLGRAGDWLGRALDSALQALRPFRRWTAAVAILVLTVAIWSLAAISFYMVMMAFHIDSGFEAAALVLTATTLSMVVPSSPGYIGVFHAVAVQTLVEVFGVDKELALTYAFGQHGLIYVLPAVLGGIFLLAHRSLWHDLLRSLRNGAASPLRAQAASAPAPSAPRGPGQPE
jgi:glycosyltransferase 2 family protein